MIVDACVEMERAGEDSRDGDSGDEERRSRPGREETVEDARNFEGMREAFEGTCSNCPTYTMRSCDCAGSSSLTVPNAGESGSAMTRVAGDPMQMLRRGTTHTVTRTYLQSSASLMVSSWETRMETLSISRKPS